MLCSRPVPYSSPMLMCLLPLCTRPRRLNRSSLRPRRSDFLTHNERPYSLIELAAAAECLGSLGRAAGVGNRRGWGHPCAARCGCEQRDLLGGCDLEEWLAQWRRGWLSGWETPVTSTPAIGTVSARWCATNSPPGWACDSPHTRHRLGLPRVFSGRVGRSLCSQSSPAS